MKTWFLGFLVITFAGIIIAGPRLYGQIDAESTVTPPPSVTEVTTEQAAPPVPEVTTDPVETAIPPVATDEAATDVAAPMDLVQVETPAPAAPPVPETAVGEGGG